MLIFTLVHLPLQSLCNRRIDDDMGRTHELEHSAIKCMRGILYCYMRQADKVSILINGSASHCFTPGVSFVSQCSTGCCCAGLSESIQGGFSDVVIKVDFGTRPKYRFFSHLRVQTDRRVASVQVKLVPCFD